LGDPNLSCLAQKPGNGTRQPKSFQKIALGDRITPSNPG
jgi:hypothetical protein